MSSAARDVPYRRLTGINASSSRNIPPRPETRSLSSAGLDEQGGHRAVCADCPPDAVQGSPEIAQVVGRNLHIGAREAQIHWAGSGDHTDDLASERCAPCSPGLAARGLSKHAGFSSGELSCGLLLVWP